jgi:hypothetical protein
MGRVDSSQWQLIETAPRDGSPILALVRPTEQGGEAVDVVRWGPALHSSENCWVAVDSDADCQFVYTDGDLACWMPPPSNFPTGRAPFESANLPEPPAETGGSGI